MDGPNSEENGGEHEIYHDTAPEIDHCHVELIAALWSITQGKNEAGNEGGEIKPFEDDAENVASCTEELFIAEGVGENMEDEEEIALEPH